MEDADATKVKDKRILHYIAGKKPDFGATPPRKNPRGRPRSGFGHSTRGPSFQGLPRHHHRLHRRHRSWLGGPRFNKDSGGTHPSHAQDHEVEDYGAYVGGSGGRVPTHSQQFSNLGMNRTNIGDADEARAAIKSVTGALQQYQIIEIIQLNRTGMIRPEHATDWAEAISSMNVLIRLWVDGSDRMEDINLAEWVLVIFLACLRSCLGLVCRMVPMTLRTKR